jgi:hypothetical protein
MQAFQPGKYDQPVQVVGYTKPGAMVFKGRASSDVMAHMCMGCGHLELYASDPQALASVPPAPDSDS